MILTGLARLGRDAEVRFTPQGDPVANLALAFNYGKKGDDGKRPTAWVDAQLWGARAEALAPYLTKGTAVCVVLEDPHIETFERRDGQTGSTLRARVVSLEFASSSERGEQRQKPDGGDAYRQAKEGKPAPKTGTGFDDMDDDIPF